MSLNTLLISPEQGLSRYIGEIGKFPMLPVEEEYMLAKRYNEHGDSEAAHKLVTSHLRLVVKMAYGYKNYGLPIPELVAEGNIGLMQAVKKFDPEKGFRLSTYAMWWIKAAMQEYILRSWSLVKVGTTAAQKKLFFNLRKMKNRIKSAENNYLTNENIEQIASDLDVDVKDVISMDQRMGGHDHSLNAIMGDEDGNEWIDILADDKENQEITIGDQQVKDQRSSQLHSAMDKLTDRERDIITKRQLADKAMTLEDLSQVYGVSRERIRQIEVRAIEKLQQNMINAQL